MSESLVTLPKLGESIVSATVVQWFKKEGDTVSLDEPLLEVATDKVNSEIPSPFAGVLIKKVARPDQELQVGETLGVIALHQGGAIDKAAHIHVDKRAESGPASTEMQDYFSPALLRLAREHNISLDELPKIPATGAGGRLSKRDLELYVEKKTHNRPCPMKVSGAPKGDVEHIKMTGMRKAIADNMVRSFYEAPHASLITEVDVTEIVKLVQRDKEAFLAKHGVKLTITTFVAQAITKALQEYPHLNSSLEGDTIVVKRFVNLGLAVSVDQGIMVPVIKNTQSLDIPQIAKAMSDLSQRARAGKLQPSEVQDGTITLTNFGISGVMIGIPIIRFPEVAIVGMGAIYKRVVELDDGSFVSRSMMNISLTFDHRVIDGMYGCGFLNALKGHLEQKVN
ncbi:MAG: dihydrolipoamide acetyltransferase family protein [Rhabdochlamydiaceae bacterium]